MRKSFLFVALALAIMLLSAEKAHSTPYDDVKKETITLVGEKNCPYNCNGYVKKKGIPEQMDFVDEYRHRDVDGYGYIIDIVKAIYEPLGLSVKYIIMPHDRAREAVISGRYKILLGQNKPKKKSKKLIFPEQSIGFSSQSFYTSMDTGWRFSGLSSLDMVTLGLIEGTEYPAIAEYIATNKNLKLRLQYGSGWNALDTNMRKLAKNRISAIYEDKYMVDYYRRIMNLEDTIIPAGAIDKPKNLYLAFSAANPNSKAYAKQFDDGITQLRKTGELQIILDKYGLQDWK